MFSKCRLGCQELLEVASALSRMFGAQREWDFSGIPHLKGASARFEGRISLLFSNCPRVPLQLQGDLRDPFMGLLRKSSFPAESRRPLRIPLQSLQGLEILIWS